MLGQRLWDGGLELWDGGLETEAWVEEVVPDDIWVVDLRDAARLTKDPPLQLPGDLTPNEPYGFGNIIQGSEISVCGSRHSHR